MDVLLEIFFMKNHQKIVLEKPTIENESIT